MHDRMRVLEAPDDVQPQVRHVRTGDGDVADREPLPGLLMRPPTRVAFDLEDPPPGALLQVALGIRRNGYRGQGQVTFRGERDGEVMFERVLDSSQDLPEAQQRWHFLEVPLPSGGELVFSATYAGTETRGPYVGFGRLRVAVPFEAPRQRPSQDNPNVMLVVIDTLRADRLSCYGHVRATSPTLDRLAAEGLRCERAYSSSSWTIPGTASVLTGLSPPAHGLGVEDSNYLPDSLETLPRLFAQAGFVTAGFTTNPLIDGSRNFDQGFGHFVNEPWAPTPDVIDQIEAWIAAVGDSRFFLYLHPTDPHAPYRASPEALARQGVVTPDDLPNELLRTTVDRWYAGGIEDRAEVERINRHYSDVYDAEIDLCDAMLARVLDALEAAGHGDDTVVCVTADHGEEFLDHGLVGHFNQLYSESIHVPLLFWGPGVTAGGVIEEPVENRHAFSTLLALADLALPEGADPVDLTRVRAPRSGVFATAKKGRLGTFATRESVGLGQMFTLVDGNWQLITCPQTEPPGHEFVYLFDLETDPECRSNVAGQHVERVQSMHQSIEAWLLAGAKTRPDLMPATQETIELMQGIGYLGDGSTDEDED